MAFSNLPLEIIIEILSRVSVRDLLRFRCASKPWRRLIDGPKFINTHLQASANPSLLLRRHSQLFSADLCSLDLAAAELSHPLMCYGGRITILGSSAGLLCLSNVADDIAVWNPSTRRHRIVPFLAVDQTRPFGTCLCHVRVHGFGHDPVSGDFKLVRLVQFFGLGLGCFECEVMVYSLPRNAWRRIDDMPYVLCYSQRNGVFASGALHWVVTPKHELENDSLVVALDLATETYREVPLPDCDGGDEKFDMDVGVLGGCLCMIANFRKVRIDVWVMERYGVKDSWTKILSVDQPEVTGSTRFLKPLDYSRSGGEVLMEKDDDLLIWYDLVNKKIRTVRMRDMPSSSFEALMLPQTLVALHPNRRMEEKKRRALESRRKMRDDFLSKGFKLVL